jgi:hypothetical protein
MAAAGKGAAQAAPRMRGGLEGRAPEGERPEARRPGPARALS